MSDNSDSRASAPLSRDAFLRQTVSMPEAWRHAAGVDMAETVQDVRPRDELERALSETLGKLEGVLSLNSRTTSVLDFEDELGRDLLRDCRRTEPPAQRIDVFELAGVHLVGGGGAGPSGVGEPDVGIGPRSEAVQLRVGSGPSVEIGAPWAAFISELRQESVSEPEPRLVATYVHLAAKALRLCEPPEDSGVPQVARRSGASEIAEALEHASLESGVIARPAAMEQLAQAWSCADATFLAALDQLKAWDSSRGSRGADQRQAGVALARLLRGETSSASTQQRLRAMLSTPESLAGLVLQGVEAHRSGARRRAAHTWQLAARYLSEEPRAVLEDAAAYFLRRESSFALMMGARAQAGQGSRTQWLMWQRRAARAGDHQGEARALHQLVREDVRVGRRELDAQDAVPAASDAPGMQARRARSQQLTAARFFRLSTLLRGLNRAREPLGDELDGLQAPRVLLDAVALDPHERVYLRRLVRWSRQRGDLQTCAKSLRTLARAYEDPKLAALAATELARTVYLGTGMLQRRQARMVERYLREALAYDPGCAPALLALRRLYPGRAQVEGALAPPWTTAEATLISARDWRGLAHWLEQHLDETTDPGDWADTAFRLAQLHAWHLSPIADARLRAEFLEQVLIAQPAHLPALVELLDVRMARQEFTQALPLLERLSDQAANARERAYWLSELGSLLEHQLGLADQAARAFSAALVQEPANTTAFLGLLRTDAAFNDSDFADTAVDAIAQRLGSGISVREGDELATELMLRAEESPRARQVLSARFPTRPLWQFIRLCTALEAGADASEPGAQHARDALHALERMWLEPTSVELLRVIGAAAGPGAAQPDEAGRTTDSSGDQPVTPREQLLQDLQRIDQRPSREGALIYAMHRAHALKDAQVDLLVSALCARRSPDYLSRVTHLSWMALQFIDQGEYAQAMKVCEHILSRTPDFLPAIKLARIAGTLLGRWADVARWCEEDARYTRVAQVAFQARLRASEVQQNYLGDFDAACEQFRSILARDPAHPDAFANLRTLLLKRGALDEMLDVFEQRLAHTGAVDARVAMLNEMAEIALYRQHDSARARGYLMRSQALEPAQLRVLRILGELHQEAGDLEAAIRAYREAIALTDSAVLVERLWVGIAELRQQAGRPEEARDAYEQVLKGEPRNAGILLSVAQLLMDSGAYRDALAYLERAIDAAASAKSERQPGVGREALAYRARCLARLSSPHDEVLAAYRALLLDDPEAVEAVDELHAYMLGAGREDQVEEFFDDLTTRAFAKMQGRPFEAHFAIAHHLGHEERAFCLAALAEARDETTPKMHQYYHAHREPRRWPQHPMPAEIVRELRPEPLSAAFLGVLQHGEAALSVALGQSQLIVPARDACQRIAIHAEDLPEAMRLALAWPGYFGLEVGDVFEVREQSDSLLGEAGSLVLRGTSGVRIYLDAGWRSLDDPTAWLFNLGRQLAGWSLGVGRWQFLDARTRFLAISRLVGIYVSGWGSAATSGAQDVIDQDQLQAWAAQEANPELAIHAMDLASRLSVQAVEPQFRLVELTQERAAAVLLDDPARVLAHTRHLGNDHGMIQQPWSFLFSRLAVHIRRTCGIAR